MRVIVFVLLLLPACVMDRDNPRCLFDCTTIETTPPPAAASAPKESK